MSSLKKCRFTDKLSNNVGEHRKIVPFVASERARTRPSDGRRATSAERAHGRARKRRGAKCA